MVHLTKWIVRLTVVTAIVAIGAMIFAGLQWASSEKALKFSQQSAADSSKETRSALHISDRIATATENQSIATRLALGDSDRIAAANERAANIYDADLRLKRAVDLDIGDGANGYQGRGKGWQTIFVVKNIGGMAIRNAQVTVFAGHGTLQALRRLWTKRPFTQLIDISPGADHHFTVTAEEFDDMYDKLELGGEVVITAVRVKFVDGNGHKQERRGCVYYVQYVLARSCDQN